MLTIHSFRQRITTWLRNLLASHVPDEAGTTDTQILIVSHGAYLSNLVSLLPRPPFNFSVAEHVDLHKPCLNTSVMRVQCTWDVDGWTGEIQSWGDVRHLLKAQQEDLGVADDVPA